MSWRNSFNSLLILGLFSPGLVNAQGDPIVFVDVFGGYSWSQDQDAESKLQVGGLPGSAELEDLDVHNGPAFGGRIGAWLKTHPNFGVAIDATHFDTDIDQQTAQLTLSNSAATTTTTRGTADIRVVNTMVSFDLIYRFRGERFTPYLMAGPGILFSDLDEGGFFGDGSKQTDDDIAFGVKAGAGVSYKISETMHIFTEYRYIHGAPEYELERSVDPLLIPTVRVNEDLEIDVDTHLVVGGLSIRF